MTKKWSEIKHKSTPEQLEQARAELVRKYDSPRWRLARWWDELRGRPPEIPPVPSDPYLLHQYTMETKRLADELYTLSDGLRDWFAWRRLHRVIVARNNAVKLQLDKLEDELDTLEERLNERA